MSAEFAYMHTDSSTASRAPDTDTAANGNAIDYSILSQAVLYRLRRAQAAVLQDFNDGLASFGLRPADFSVLVVVSNNHGLKQSDVAEALGIQRANFVAIIDALEAKGLLVRRKSESDRRVQFLHMTEEGEEMLEQISSIWQDSEDRLIERLGGETQHAMLVDLLKRIRE